MICKIQLTAFWIILLLITYIGLYWLALGLLLALSICFLFKSNLSLFIWFRKFSFISNLISIVGIFILAISIRVFSFEIYSIPSGSMENTLLTGDIILVSKLNYGPILPKSPYEIPWINLLWYLSADKTINIDSACWGYNRLNGFSSIKHGDVTVFIHPLWVDKDNYFIKRCVGIPGDTLQIINGVVFANQKGITIPDRAKQPYDLKVNNRFQFRKLVDSLDIEDWWNNHGITMESIGINMTRLQQSQLIGRSCIDSISISLVGNDSTQWIYQDEKRIKWTIDNFGPIVIPAEGMTITLSPFNFLIYQETINHLEKSKIEEKNEKFYLDGNSITTYTFKYNYYFMMGDNRHNSKDSRYWGFVPEENIVGKAITVLFSKDQYGFRWQRILKRVI